MTGTSPTQPRIFAGFFQNNVAVFSLRGVGTKTLQPQRFRLKFKFNRVGEHCSTIDQTQPGPCYPASQTETINIAIAPFSGSLMVAAPPESQSFLYGASALSIQVGNAALHVPLGRTADLIGVGYLNYEEYSYRDISSLEFLSPDWAESAFLAEESQFDLHRSPLNKSTYGTPWSFPLIGWYCEKPEVFSAGGHRYKVTNSSLAPGSNYLLDVARLGLHSNDPSTRKYVGGARPTLIHDQDEASGSWIRMDRHVDGRVYKIATSDEREWNLFSDPVSKHITGVVPVTNGNKGARYYSWSGSMTSGGRVTEVRLSPTEGQDVLYRFEYYSESDVAGLPAAARVKLLNDLKRELHNIDGTLTPVVEHSWQVEQPENRVRKNYVSDSLFRQYEFSYGQSAALPHRLDSIIAHSGLNGDGSALPTVYDFALTPATDPSPSANNAELGQLRSVTLPDGTQTTYSFDAGIGASRNIGLRTKTTTQKHGEQLITQDIEYEFTYSAHGDTLLYYAPRIIKSRDGRGNETVYSYEPGGEASVSDPGGGNDGIPGQKSNQLWTKSGPLINDNPDNVRQAVVQYSYCAEDGRIGLLKKEELLSVGQPYRTTTYDYDELGRLKERLVDPEGVSLKTRHLYSDEAGQMHIVIDPYNYWSRTRYDDYGRILSTRYYLVGLSGASEPSFNDDSTPFYETQREYDTAGRLMRELIDHKNQDGTPRTPSTIVRRYEYDGPLERISRVILELGGGQEQITSFKYNFQGDVEAQTDTFGRGIIKTYDGRGLLINDAPIAKGEGDPALRVVTALGTSYTYDSVGRLAFVTKPTGAKTKWVYDAVSRVKEEWRIPGPDGGATVIKTYEYDNDSHVTRTFVTENGTVLSDVTELFDKGGFNYQSRQRMESGQDLDAQDFVSVRLFDVAGNLIEERTKGDATVMSAPGQPDKIRLMLYDGANRLEFESNSEGGEVLHEWTKLETPSVLVHDTHLLLTGEEVATSTTHHDALGRIVRVVQPPDANGHRHYVVCSYDSRGNVLRETSYDAATDTAVQSTVYTYDAAGRETQRATLAVPGAANPTPSPAVDRMVTTQYDPDGRVLKRA